MRKRAIENSPRATLRLVGAGVGERASAYSPFGPVRAGLTTKRTIPDLVLSELLSSLESKIEFQESKYLEVLDTLKGVTARLAELTNSPLPTDITKEKDV